MYLVIASALAVAALSTQLLRWRGMRTLRGEAIAMHPKEMTPRGARYWLGGTVFGLGWGLLGACPGANLRAHRGGRDVDDRGTAQRISRHMAVRRGTVAATTLGRLCNT